MAKINVLPAKVYNRIAAGEVVERPVSVVKELVENSIDAGATEISIQIERAGRDCILLTDNGSGIEKEDLRSAFLPHATSKISCVEDLNCIGTLGFRGEAVASIASVSRMKIISKTEAEDCAWELECNGGDIGIPVQTAAPNGTTVQVKNLFYNTPAREKFLKTDKSEETEISAMVARFILGHSDISFRYVVDGKVCLQSFGGDMDECIAAVYGASTLDKCFKIGTVKNGISIYGYIGNTNFFKSNRSYQTTFVNGRYVTNSTLVSALTNAYSGYTMKRQYPFYVLFINLPGEVVDVNVHPQKADVRFADNKVVYSAVYSVVSAVLDGSSAALDFIASEAYPRSTMPAEEAALPQEPVKTDAVTPTPIPDNGFRSFQSEGSSKTEELSKSGGSSVAAGSPVSADAEGEGTLSYQAALEAIRQLRLQNEAVSARKSAQEAVPFPDVPNAEEERLVSSFSKPIVFENCKKAEGEGASAERDERAESQREAQKASAERAEEDAFAANKRFLEEQENKKKQQPKIDFERAVYKGNLFNTYLLFELGDDAYIIDQHAAHERLLFDRLCQKMRSRSVDIQPLLLPYILNVNFIENDFLQEKLPLLKDLGFDIEIFGTNAFKISGIPVELTGMDLESFFCDILKDISGLKAIKLDELLRDKLASKACKHAVKGGMNLTEQEVKELFSMMDGNMGLKCPHGRPVAVRMQKSEIEKMFKRIV